jgi:hypothetical protein
MIAAGVILKILIKITKVFDFSLPWQHQTLRENDFDLCTGSQQQA